MINVWLLPIFSRIVPCGAYVLYIVDPPYLVCVHSPHLPPPPHSSLLLADYSFSSESLPVLVQDNSSPTGSDVCLYKLPPDCMEVQPLEFIPLVMVSFRGWEESGRCVCRGGCASP